MLFFKRNLPTERRDKNRVKGTEPKKSAAAGKSVTLNACDLPAAVLMLHNMIKNNNPSTP